MRKAGFFVFPCLLSMAGCAEPLDAPSAFSSEEYLCDDEHEAELDARVEQCRQDHVLNQSCAGILSFRGILDSVPVVLDTRIVMVSYSDDLLEAGGVIRTVTINAFAPYFALRLDFSNFAVPPALTPNGMVEDITCLIGNAKTGSGCAGTQILNLEARGGNYLSSLVSAVREMKIETLEEMRVIIHGGLARGGNIDACFHVFSPL